MKLLMLPYRMRTAAIAVSLFGLLSAAGALQASAAEPRSYAPWQILSGAYDTAVRTGRMLYLPQQPPAGQSEPNKPGSTVQFLGADNGGLSRSVDLGKSWENVNGGRGFSDSVCGGYLDADIKDCTAAKDRRLFLNYSGPPSGANAAGKFQTISDVAVGGLPPEVTSAMQGQAIGPPRAGLTYRASGNLFVSVDAGRQWAPLAPQCTLRDMSNTGAVAVDGGNAGHIVTASFTDAQGAIDARSSCLSLAPGCGIRTIAYNQDVGLQVAATLAAVAGPPTGDPGTNTWSGPTMSAVKNVETAGDGWRYSSLIHLGAPVRKWLGGEWRQSKCEMNTTDESALIRTVPSPTCTAVFDSACHGAKVKNGTTIADEQWCPNLAGANADPACKCKDLSTPPSHAWLDTTPPPFCHYPAVRYLEIDPRNGFAYASTLVGLLTSPDGGKKWLRFGNGSVEDCSANGATATIKEVKDADPYTPGNAVDWPPPNHASKPLAARLLSHQYVPICGPGTERSDLNAFDLNAWPEYITHVGRMALSFQPCKDVNGNEKFYEDMPSRKRGTMTATLPVEWRVRQPADPKLKDVRVSGVMVAFEPDDCQGQRDAPGALTFRDSASVLKGQAGVDAAWGIWTDDKLSQVTGHKPNKLPRQQARRKANEAPKVCPMRYFSAAVAPSDNRFLYAWGFSDMVTPADWDKAGVPLAPNQESPAVRGCNFMTGLYRSLDRGHSWHLASGISDPNALGQPEMDLMTEVALSVAPHNPYLVMIASSWRRQIGSGSGASFLFEPADIGEVYTSSDFPQKSCGTLSCPGCIVESNAPILQDTSCAQATCATTLISSTWTACGQRDAGLAWSSRFCRKDRVHPDLCELFKPNIADGVSCSREVDGIVECGIGKATAPDVPVIDSAPPQCLHVPPWAADALSPGGAPTVVSGARRLTKSCVACPGSKGEQQLVSSTSEPAACCVMWRDLTQKEAPGAGVLRFRSRLTATAAAWAA